MAQEFTSYKNRLNDFGFRQGSFKNDQGETVNYQQTVIKVEIDGAIEEIVLSSANSPRPKLLETILRGAKPVTRGGFLDDETE